MAGAIRVKHMFLYSSILASNNNINKALSRLPRRGISVIAGNLSSSETKKKEKEKRKRRKEIEVARETAEAVVKKEKRRTRSSREYEIGDGDGEAPSSHVPVMLGEVMDVFSSVRLRSFVDCTLGAAGHSSSIIQSHSELNHFVGMDVDPVARKLAHFHIDSIVHPTLKASIVLKNFKYIKSAVADSHPELLDVGVDGILMDLGMSSMQVNNPERGFSVLQQGPLDMRMDPQASLTAEDIVNSWPESELGRILREYGEESNWHLLQTRIVKARLTGGLHSTGDLVDLIKRMSPPSRGGRQGWIKTATRVFQGLRIAVNDELKTLQNALYSSFDVLSPGGRLAVISFHSLEDRVVKQTFLDILGFQREETNAEMSVKPERQIEERIDKELKEKEAWIKQTVISSKGVILTKRPITPSEEEEKLNRRARSAKLRVIQKL
ncbi:ribosomal RNA small subunit methyltransferase H [Brassica rapa]|uniref:ribosomal RNA small subunit methyltransferase H n=1 Tax=Brassica campestris TaxID=3711 RepID=UPI0004F14C55|nr:ribosomal RNA small subunit methyltransferase H [Brassica rapa]